MLVRLGDIYVNAQLVRVLTPNGKHTTIEFGSQHKVGVELPIYEVANALDPELDEYDDD